MAFILKNNRIETENKNIRFPLPLIEKIEKSIENTDLSFSRFVIQACEYALDNIEDTSNDNKDKMDDKK